MASSGTSLKAGDSFPVQADNSFTVEHNGATLVFELDLKDKKVKLVSIAEPPSTPQPSGSSAPKEWKLSDVLGDLTTYNCTYIHPLYVKSIADFTDSLRYFEDISQHIQIVKASKPRLLLRSDALADLGSRKNFDQAVRSALGRRATLDAGIVGYPIRPGGKR